MCRFLVSLAALGGWFAATAAAAEPFAIDLDVRSGKASKTAHAESAARDAKPTPSVLRQMLQGLNNV